MESPAEPLISEQQRHDETHHDADADSDAEGMAAADGGAPKRGKPGARPGAFVLLLTVAAGISGLLFGCT